MEETPEGKVFLTVHVPPPRLIVIGAVHISQALAPMAALLDYDVTIIDPRTAFASPERFPGVKLIAEWPDVALPPLNVDRYTAFVLVTHDPKIDDPALVHALERDCFYIGALGSRKTHGRRLERMKGAGHRRQHAVAHPCTDRPEYRRDLAAGNRGVDHGRDHRAPAAAAAGPEAGAEAVKFGTFSPAQAEGGIVVHSIRKDGLVLKKGTLVGREEVAALEAAQIPAVTIARLEPGDISEDEAAADIAAAVAGDGVRVDGAFTGRANLFAESAGVLVVDHAAIDRLNEVDADITFATLEAFAPVVVGKMVATVKIVPFAISPASRDAALGVAQATKPLVRVAPYTVKKVGVISTVLPGLADKVIEEDPESDCGSSCARRRENHRRSARAARNQGARRGAR